MTPPESVRRVVVVGAGGFAREVAQWAHAAWPDAARRLGGFLSADPRALDGHAIDLPILGNPADFIPAPGDGFLLAIGIPEVRRRVAEQLLKRHAMFISLIHPTAIVARTAVIGAGSILCPHSIVSDAARLGRCVLMNYHTSIGHDGSVGDYAVLSPYATLGGNAHVADDVFLGMHASVGPGRAMGPRSKLSANSCALTDVPGDSLVFGVPGRIQPLVRLDGSS